MSKYITGREAAKILGVIPRRVTAMIKQGQFKKLKRMECCGAWMLRESEVLSLKNKRKKEGAK